MVLPEGFTLPPIGYLVPVVVVLLVSIWLLWALRPSVTDRLVVAVVPWMVAGGAAHAMYVVEALPGTVEPLFGVPSVYLTVGALAGAIWLAAEVTTSTHTRHDPATYLFVAGTLAAIVALGGLLAWGHASDELSPGWPLAGIVGAVILTAVGWAILDRWFPMTATLSAWTGVVVLFGHALDGVTTAIGIDILGTGERSPIAEAVIELGGLLPTAAYIGDAWLFVLVKLALPLVVLVLFRDYLEVAPSRARVLLAFIAAVGLGPGAYNLLLFLLSA